MAISSHSIIFLLCPFYIPTGSHGRYLPCCAKCWHCVRFFSTYVPAFPTTFATQARVNSQHYTDCQVPPCRCNAFILMELDNTDDRPTQCRNIIFLNPRHLSSASQKAPERMGNYLIGSEPSQSSRGHVVGIRTRNQRFARTFNRSQVWFNRPQVMRQTHTIHLFLRKPNRKWAYAKLPL